MQAVDVRSAGDVECAIVISQPVRQRQPFGNDARRIGQVIAVAIRERDDLACQRTRRVQRTVGSRSQRRKRELPRARIVDNFFKAGQPMTIQGSLRAVGTVPQGTAAPAARRPNVRQSGTISAKQWR